jgi:hypothetical protein
MINRLTKSRSYPIESAVETLLKGDRRIIAGPWLGELGFEVLYWIPALRWCVSRWPELRERLVVVSRGGVAGWYEGIADSYLDIFDALDEDAYVERMAAERAHRKTRWANALKQLEETEWERELARWASDRLGEPELPLLHPATLYHSLKLVGQLSRSSHDGFDLWQRPERGPLASVLPERYVAMRFYRNGKFKGPEAESFAREAARSLADVVPVVNLDPGMEIDPKHPEIRAEEPNIISLAHHMTFRDNLALQSIAIANAAAYVGTVGGLSFVPPGYGVRSFTFWSAPGLDADFRIENEKKAFGRDIDIAMHAFNRPGWGGYSARSAHEAPVEDLIAPIARRVTAPNDPA